MISADRIYTAKRYLRRKYQGKVEELKTLADKVAEEGFEAVTITGNGYEGGSANAVLTFEPLEYLAAVEDIIAELDPDSPSAAPMVVHSDFSQRIVET